MKREIQRETGAASNSITFALPTDPRPMKIGEEEQEESECSSGCQSGWTMYLDHSYENYPTSPLKKATSWQEEEEEEDLSMISDASSGPPHYNEQADEQCRDDAGRCFCYSSPPPPAALAKNAGKRRRVESGKQQTTQQDEPPTNLLDDTASSPVFCYSKAATTTKNMTPNAEDVLEFSCGFSATHFKGKPVFQKHLGRLQTTSPVKPTSAIPICSNEGDTKTW